MAILSTKKEEQKGEVSYSADASSGSGKTAAIKIPTVLIQPRISEKSGKLVQMNKYVFKVKTSANKIEVKKAVEGAYKVRVVQVNMVINQGKNRTFGRTSGKTQAFKKAIVTLKKGDKIEGLTEGI